MLQQSVEYGLIQFARSCVLQIVLVMFSVPVARAPFVVYVGPATTVLDAPSPVIEHVTCALLCSDAGIGLMRYRQFSPHGTARSPERYTSAGHGTEESGALSIQSAGSFRRLRRWFVGHNADSQRGHPSCHGGPSTPDIGTMSSFPTQQRD